MAIALGTNAIVGIAYETMGPKGGILEVTSYGTAVKL